MWVLIMNVFADVGIMSICVGRGGDEQDHEGKRHDPVNGQGFYFYKNQTDVQLRLRVGYNMYSSRIHGMWRE